MLVPAVTRESELRVRFLERVLDPDMRYYYFQSFCDYELVIDRNDWKRVQFVSISRTGELLAYFEARLNRESQVVEDLLFLNLCPQSSPYQGCSDGLRFIAYLLGTRNFRKIFFRFIKDNPAARQYQRILVLAGCGSVQGVLTDYATLADGQVYDVVIMDIQRQPYLTWFGSRHALYPAA